MVHIFLIITSTYVANCEWTLFLHTSTFFNFRNHYSHKDVASVWLDENFRSISIVGKVKKLDGVLILLIR